MKINPIQNYSVSQTPNAKVNTFISNYKATDSITFGANNIKQELSPLEEHGLGVAKKLMKMQRSSSLTRKNISQYLNSVSPVPINVEHVSQMPEQIRANIPKVAAHMVPLYNNNIELMGANIYIKDATTSKEAGDLIANTAHEFTHVLQRQADNTYYGIKSHTKDVEQITGLARLSQALYNAAMQEFFGILRFDDEFQAKLRNGIIPNTKEIDKYLSKNGRKQYVADYISKQAESVTQHEKRLSKNLQTDEIVKIVKNWIAKESSNEVEAYNVTIAALKQWGKYDIDTLLQRSVTRSVNEIISKLF